MSEYVSKLFGLKDRVVILTGAGGFLIGEIAQALAQAGCRVAVTDINKEKADAVARQITDRGGHALAIQLDVKSKDSVTSGLNQTLKHFGALDFAVNGAGTNSPVPFLDIALEDWESVVASQLTGTMICCQVFGGHLVSQKKGAIVNISSASAGPPLSKAFAYSAAKAAIVNLTKNLAREWAPAQVRVNALRPGFFPTEWNRKNFITPEREAAILNHTPMNRFGEPSELVGAVIWLLSDSASFVTGAEIAVDGGFSAMTI